MRGLFRREEGHEAPASGAAVSASEFTVIRVEVPERLLAADTLVLRLEAGGSEHRLLPAELDDAVDFLVPAELLEGGRIVLEAGDEEVADPPHGPSPRGVHDVYLALQQELVAQDRRIDALRADLRRERSRPADDPAAED
jgi:hypothetical protein